MAEYAAFGTQLKKGIAQVETATAAGTITGNGNAEVIVTAAGVTGSPVTLAVAVLEDDTQDTWAGKVRAAIAANGPITALYGVSGSGDKIILTRLIAAANDATLNISLDNDTCTGITTAASSANTRAGVALTTIAQVSNIGGPSLAADTEDVTTHDSTGAWEEVVVTILRSGEVTADIVYDPAAATHADLVDAAETRTIYDWSIVFPSSSPVTWNFDGYLAGFEPSAPHDGALTASVTIKLSGAPTLV